MKNNLMQYFPNKSIVPLSRIDIAIRKLRIFTLSVIDKNFKKF